MTGGEWRWDPADPDTAPQLIAGLMRAGAGWEWPEHMGAAAVLTIWYLGSRMPVRPGDVVVWDGDGLHVRAAPAPPDVRLRRITEDDAGLLVRWRNENAKYFPPQPDWTVESHLRWFREVHRHDPCENQFMVEYQGRPIGTLAMTIRDGRGELERMILGEKSLARGGIMRTAFRQLMDAYGLRSYWLRVYPWNEVTIAFHRRNGFEVTGQDGDYLIMERDGRQPWPDTRAEMPPPVMSRVLDEDGAWTA